MKRSLNILMALMLSLMVVYLSVGTTVMHCLHYDKVMVGMVTDCCVKRSMHQDCCQGKLGTQVNKHCMKVELVKLSPNGLYPTLGFRCSTNVCRHRASPLADVASSCYL